MQYGQIAELTSQYKVRNLQYNAEVRKSLIYNDCIYTKMNAMRKTKSSAYTTCTSIQAIISIATAHQLN